MIILEPTAAFVMKMAEAVYRETAFGNRFLDQLDLSSAADLMDDHRRIGIFELGQQAMCNRKFAVRAALFRLLEEVREPMQIVLLAAGKSPLGLEALIAQPQNITHVFEVDVTPFEAKAKLYTLLDAQAAQRVRFLEHDILAEALLSRLTAEGYDPARPTVLVMEGIGHYLTHAQTALVISRFASGARRNRLIFEYVPTFDAMNEAARAKRAEALALVQKRYHPPGMTQYAPDWLAQVLKGLGGEVTEILRMQDMEHLRTGRNEWFTEPLSDWLEVAVGEL